jgi:hypothetical protein
MASKNDDEKTYNDLCKMYPDRTIRKPTPNKNLNIRLDDPRIFERMRSFNKEDVLRIWHEEMWWGGYEPDRTHWTFSFDLCGKDFMKFYEDDIKGTFHESRVKEYSRNVLFDSAPRDVL